MNKTLSRILSGIIAIGLILVLASCGATQSSSAKALKSGEINEENLDAVCDILNEAGLSNVDVFKEWVNSYLRGDFDTEGVSGFNDADCRMTVMLLAGNSIEAESVQEDYGGTYLMFDLEAIDNQEAYNVLKDKRTVFTILFGEMPIPESGFADTFTENLKKHGIKFNGEKYFVVSLLFKAYEEENAFVGHAGILMDCREMAGVDTDYLFVEKIAFNDSYMLTLVKDEDELIKILSERADYTVEDGDPSPLIYKNDQLVGLNFY